MKLEELVEQAGRDLAEAGMPARRVRRALESLRAQLPDSGELEGFSVCADGGRIVVADGASRWEPDSGQIVMDLGGEPGSEARSFAPGNVSGTLGSASCSASLRPRPAPPSLAARASDSPGTSPGAAALAPSPRILDVTELAARAAERSRQERADAAMRRPGASASSPADADTAAHWFEHACELEAESRPEAIQAYHRALELDASLTDAHVNLGRLYCDAKDHPRAEAHYRAAILSAATDPLPWFNLGVLLHDLKRVPEAVEAYQKAIALDRDYADAHYNLALLLEALGRKGPALTHLMTARRLFDSGTP